MSALKEKLRKVEILLVEDSMGDYLLITRFLRDSVVQSNVNVVRNGQDAVDYLQQTGRFGKMKRPDLILMDLNLPLKSGQEVLREIKTDAQLSSIPVIVFTDSDSAEDAVEAYRSKAEFYMVKPKNLDQFATSIYYIEKIWLEKMCEE